MVRVAKMMGIMTELCQGSEKEVADGNSEEGAQQPTSLSLPHLAAVISQS